MNKKYSIAYILIGLTVHSLKSMSGGVSKLPALTRPALSQATRPFASSAQGSGLLGSVFSQKMEQLQRYQTQIKEYRENQIADPTSKDKETAEIKNLLKKATELRDELKQTLREAQKLAPQESDKLSPDFKKYIELYKLIPKIDPLVADYALKAQSLVNDLVQKFQKELFPEEKNSINVTPKDIARSKQIQFNRLSYAYRQLQEAVNLKLKLDYQLDDRVQKELYLKILNNFPELKAITLPFFISEEINPKIEKLGNELQAQLDEQLDRLIAAYTIHLKRQEDILNGYRNVD